MKLKYIFIVLILISVYGFLPVTFPSFSDKFDLPNTLLIDRQECGCPCAEGVIQKGMLKFTDEFKQQFPTLNEANKQIELVDFPPFDNITSDNPMTLDYANSNQFRVTGQVIGVDTISCDPANCEIVPRFQVNKWKTTTYYPKFWLFSKQIFIIYWVIILLALPTLTIITIIKWRRKAKL